MSFELTYTSVCDSVLNYICIYNMYITESHYKPIH